MRKTTRLRQLIENPPLLAMPGVHDAISAGIAERAGFAAPQVSGAKLAACRDGLTDSAIVAMSQTVQHTGRTS